MKQFNGRWRIIWMEEWDQGFVDLVEPGYFQFDGEEGQFVFGAVQGEIDARYSDDGGKVNFSWQGVDEGDDVNGRGWFISTGSGTAEGRLFFHAGDESGIGLEKET